MTINKLLMTCKELLTVFLYSLTINLKVLFRTLQRHLKFYVG